MDSSSLCVIVTLIVAVSCSAILGVFTRPVLALCAALSNLVASFYTWWGGAGARLLGCSSFCLAVLLAYRADCLPASLALADLILIVLASLHFFGEMVLFVYLATHDARARVGWPRRLALLLAALHLAEAALSRSFISFMELVELVEGVSARRLSSLFIGAMASYVLVIERLDAGAGAGGAAGGGDAGGRDVVLALTDTA